MLKGISYEKVCILNNCVFISCLGKSTEPIITTQLQDANVKVQNPKPMKTCFIIALKSSTSLIEGQKGEIAVKIDGIPTPTIRWTFHNSNVTENDNIHFERTTDGWFKIKFDVVMSTDKGRYKCLASNSGGMASCFTDVTIKQAVRMGEPTAFKDLPVWEGLEKEKVIFNYQYP